MSPSDGNMNKRERESFFYDAETLSDCYEYWLKERPDEIWLRERSGDEMQEWSWRQACAEFKAISAWLQQTCPEPRQNIAILSRNRAHWILADMAIMAAGHVSIPLFTTHPREITDYILNFTDARLIFLGESENWDSIRKIVSPHTKIVTLPGVEMAGSYETWSNILKEYSGQAPNHSCEPDDLYTVVFTSGTTGMPKGVMQTHKNMLISVPRTFGVWGIPGHPRLLSYLPLSHFAERYLISFLSLLTGGVIYFNEGPQTMLRDLAEAKPQFFFAVPRVYQSLQQAVIDKYGSKEELEKALLDDPELCRKKIRSFLGLDEGATLISGSAPISESLLLWYEDLGIIILEVYGSSEAIGPISNTFDRRRIGSVGVPSPGVEVNISPEGELLLRFEGLPPEYYKKSEAASELCVDGWFRTGEIARVDEDGFYYITGRLKDYFKTIHGKYVAPKRVEDLFEGAPGVDQMCLLGRGFSKTVMVCTLAPGHEDNDMEALKMSLIDHVEQVNKVLEKHERIGVVILSRLNWTIDNGYLTPSTKIKRQAVEDHFGEKACELAQQAAEQKQILIDIV